MVDNNDYVEEANVILIESYYVNIDMEIMEYYNKDGIFFILCYISQVELHLVRYMHITVIKCIHLSGIRDIKTTIGTKDCHWVKWKTMLHILWLMLE